MPETYIDKYIIVLYRVSFSDICILLSNTVIYTFFNTYLDIYIYDNFLDILLFQAKLSLIHIPTILTITVAKNTFYLIFSHHKL